MTVILVVVELITGECRGIVDLEQDIAAPTRSVTLDVTHTGLDPAEIAGPGERL